MQYTKPMIDQVFQIRKAVPDHLRSQIKLANPHLLNMLAELYRDLHDKLLRELITQLMSMAGPSWLSLLENPAPVPRPPHHQQMYRGQIRQQAETLTPDIAAPDTAGKPATTPGNKEKIIIYRGQVVHP
jgi:hypothetical protein